MYRLMESKMGFHYILYIIFKNYYLLLVYKYLNSVTDENLLCNSLHVESVISNAKQKNGSAFIVPIGIYLDGFSHHKGK